MYGEGADPGPVVRLHSHELMSLLPMTATVSDPINPIGYRGGLEDGRRHDRGSGAAIDFEAKLNLSRNVGQDHRLHALYGGDVAGHAVSSRRRQ